MNGLALCAGIGGIELGLHILFGDTYRTRCFVEREAYPAACLIKRMRERLIPKAPVWSNLKSFDGKPWHNKIHILTGGYPCQPFSVAGAQRAEADPRHLWPDVRRIVQETQAPVLFFENVANHAILGFIEVRKSLREMGYIVKAGFFQADEVGATHRRRRLFILAYRSEWRTHLQERRVWQVGNTNRPRLEGWHQSKFESPHELSPWPPGPKDGSLWGMVLKDHPERSPAIEPDFRRVVNGVSGVLDPTRHRTHRLRALGNAVCPLVAAYAFNTLLDDWSK